MLLKHFADKKAFHRDAFLAWFSHIVFLDAAPQCADSAPRRIIDAPAIGHKLKKIYNKARLSPKESSKFINSRSKLSINSTADATT